MRTPNKIIATAVLAASLLGGTVALASPASAVGSSACVHSTVPNDNFNHHRYPEALGDVMTNGLRLRSGPGTGYRTLGLLHRHDGIRVVCTSAGDRWLYGKVLDGSNRGRWGWVSRAYTYLLYTS